MASTHGRSAGFAIVLIAVISFTGGVSGQTENFPGHTTPRVANQAAQYPNSVQPPVETQTVAPIIDPVQAIEAQVYSLQCQLDSMCSVDNRVGCSGYDNCGDARCNRCCNAKSCGLYLGAAAVFAKPHYKEAFQYSQTNLVTGQQTLVPFDYDYEATPRVWLGFKAANGLGFQVNYWYYQGDGQTSSNVADGFNIYGAHAITIIFPANIFAILPGEELINMDSLQTQIINYYATYDATVGRLEVIGSVGLRQASLKQTLNSVVLDPGGSPIRQLNWQRKYNGLGPSISLDVKRRIGCSPLSFFANGGGALLFGTKTLDRTVFGDQSPQPASPFLSLDDADEVIGIGEVGLGLEFSRPLNSGHNLVIRGSYEGQLWAEAGAPTLGFLGFEGFAVQLGLNR